MYIKFVNRYSHITLGTLFKSLLLFQVCAAFLLKILNLSILAITETFRKDTARTLSTLGNELNLCRKLVNTFRLF